MKPGHPVQYAAIFLTCFIDILGFGIVIPVLPLYAEHFGANAVQIGWLVGIFSLGQFLFAPVWGRLSDRIGRKPVLLIGLAGTVAGYLLMGAAATMLMLFVGRAVDGVSGANIGVAQAYLADISTPENRARAMGLLGAAFGLGFVFGPALGGWATVAFRNFAAPMYVAAGLAAINFLFVWTCLPETRRADASGRGAIFPHLFAHVDRARFLRCLAGYFLTIAGFSIVTAFFALTLAHRFGIDVLHTSYILAGLGIIGVVIQGGLIGRLVRRFGESRLALTGSMVMAVGMATLAVSEGTRVMLAGTILIGIGNSLVMPAISALASRSADADWQGRALGVMQSVGSLARWAGPLLAGFLLDAQIRHGGGVYGLLPLAASAGLLVAASMALYSLHRANRPG